MRAARIIASVTIGDTNLLNIGVRSVRVVIAARAFCDSDFFNFFWFVRASMAVTLSYADLILVRMGLAAARPVRMSRKGVPVAIAITIAVNVSKVYPIRHSIRTAPFNALANNETA